MTEATVCVTNINRAGKRRRMAMGVLVLAGTVVLHFVLRTGELTPWSGAAVVAAAFAMLCIVQALENT